MSKKTEEVLAGAKAMNMAELEDAIEALEFLGDEATANHQEYKDLKRLIEVAKLGSGADEGVDDSMGEEDIESSELDGGEPNEGQDTDDVEELADEVTSNQRLSYKGIKMIGAFWYSKSDGYKQRFDTADECALHFNGE